MAIAALGVMAWFERAGASVELVRTLGFVTFSLTHIYAVYTYRFPQRSIFNMETFNNSRLNWSILSAFVATLLATELSFLQRWLELVSLDLAGWLFCAAVASLTLWVSELYKWLAKPQ
jgi:magnesium-transporting ATPase (P-type)